MRFKTTKSIGNTKREEIFVRFEAGMEGEEWGVWGGRDTCC